MVGEGTLAQEAYDGGDMSACREHALRGLEDHPDDVALLRLAGRASLELAEQDAETYLRRLLDLEPDDGAAWRDLGLNRLNWGDATGARDALERAVELIPDDEVARVNLAHVAFTTGDRSRAVQLLEDLAADTPQEPGALRSLLEMHRTSGDDRAALEVAEQLAARDPQDVLAAVEVADLQLSLEQFEAAAAAFTRVRALDDEPGHAVFAYHGVIEAEARAGRWRQALDQAIEATTVDRHQLTTDLLTTAAAQLFGGSGQRQPPPWHELLQALAHERAEHRRLHQAPVSS